MSECNDTCKYYKNCWSRGEYLKEDGEECVHFEPDRPNGEWKEHVERKNLNTRKCTSCGEYGAVGYFCMWCGADMMREGDEK